MVLPTGTATLWRLLEELSEEAHYYVYDGPEGRVQGREYLAEQLRQDGAASSLGAALSMSENAELRYAWVYQDEDTDRDTFEFDDPDRDDARIVLTAKVSFDD